MQKSVELDWASEADPTGRLYAERNGLRSKVINTCGPGGGNPVVRFTGPEDKIERLLTSHRISFAPFIIYL